jgi:hypothetical protein
MGSTISAITLGIHPPKVGAVSVSRQAGNVAKLKRKRIKVPVTFTMTGIQPKAVLGAGADVTVPHEARPWMLHMPRPDYPYAACSLNTWTSNRPDAINQASKPKRLFSADYVSGCQSRFSSKKRRKQNGETNKAAVIAAVSAGSL